MFFAKIIHNPTISEFDRGTDFVQGRMGRRSKRRMENILAWFH